MGRGKIAAVTIVTLAAAGATAATLSLRGGNASGEQKAGNLPPKTAMVSRQTLTDAKSVDGRLGYGTTTTATSRLPGTLTKMPETGDRVGRGKPLYEVDGKPVTLLYGRVPAYRALKVGSQGQDVEQLERNLKALGYDGFTVDDDYTQATADAVEQWQDDLDLDQTGTVELGRVVFAPGPVRVDSLHAGQGDPTGPGQKVLTYTGTTKAVTVELDTVDQRLAREGAKVSVTLPDDTDVAGRISDVTTLIQPGANPGDDPTTKVEVEVALPSKKAQKAAGSYVLASVQVAFTAERRKGVLTVPVAALVSLPGGGFGVEVVSGGTSQYVPVKTGLFASGQVEVSGTGISEGTQVGVPA